MNVPQSQNLHSQSFNSEFVEFVWKFPIDKVNEKMVSRNDFPFDSKLVTILLVCNIDKDGNIIVNPWLHDEFDNCDMYVTNDVGITDFISNEELEQLKMDTIKYLKIS
jgi:hypothetical protein